MIYTEDAISDETFDITSMSEGDEFHMNGTHYTIERKFEGGPFMVFTKNPVILFVVSFIFEGVKRFQVCNWDGDWEGCTPVEDSTDNALFAELARRIEIDDHDDAQRVKGRLGE